MKNFDTVVIGFGKAGKTLAGALAKKGEKVALIEKSKEMYGGTCINVACIPSKFLVQRAKISSKVYHDFDSQKEYFEKTSADKKAFISKLRQKNYAKLDSLENVTIFDGFGSFVDEHTVKVETESETFEVYGEKIIINTGAYSFMPNIEGLKDNPYVFDSKAMLDISYLPTHLVIIGGGYIGLEFASMFNNFGSKVTILQNLPDFLPREDKEIADEVLKTLTKKGIDVLFNVEITKVDQSGNVHFKQDGKDHTLPSDAILVATGRRANLKGLNLESANVKYTERGIGTNEFLQTNVPHIYAVGDVRGDLQFTYLSLDDYRIVFSKLYGDQSYDLTKRQNIPYSVFIDPAFSRVGLTEKEAREKGYDVLVSKIPTASIPKAMLLESTDGLLKVIVDAKTNLILGAHLFCEESYELINTIKLAMDQKITYEKLKNMIYTHPTMTESFNDLFANF